MWKRVTSDCIPKDSVFEIVLAPETIAAQEKSRLFDAEQKTTENRRVRSDLLGSDGGRTINGGDSESVDQIRRAAHG